MPSHTESLSAESRQEFCLALKAARERKGIPLSQIADTTKIPSSLFAALERNDLRRWPKGLFRRSFFRDYARAIGLDVAEACEEFVRLFPDDEGTKAIHETAASDADQGTGVRLAFDVTWHGPRPSILLRLAAASLDMAAIIGISATLFWTTRLPLPTSTAIVAVAYCFVATILFGESPAKWAITKRHSIADALGRSSAAVSSAPVSVASVFSSVFGHDDGTSSDRADEPERERWVTDARRVGVRVKIFQ